MSKNENKRLLDKRLLDKIVLITGAGSGIGRATSFRFAKEGAKIIVLDINLENAEETANIIKNEIKSDAIAIKCDISNTKEVKTAVKQVYDQFPRLDILFNNAGIGTFSFGELVNVSEQVWDNVMNINLRGTWIVTKYFSKKMKKQEIVGELRAKIINNASILGRVPTSPLGVYSISKAAILAMTKIFATELAPFKITVNAICPGFHLTSIYLNDESVLQEILENWGRPIPLERIGTADDVARVMFFLASQDSDYMTGQSISVDGGCYFL